MTSVSGEGYRLLHSISGPPASSYPSCASGGTHYTHQESYLKIKKVSDALWQVFGKDGTRTDFEPIYSEPGLPAFRFGQTRVVDTHGNTVTYNWAVNAGGINGNTYPSSITYNGYSVEFFRETRPDLLTRPGLTNIIRAADRLKTIVVRRGINKIRAYKLAYTTSPAGKSLLASVRMYGKDVDVDAAGNIGGGTALPAQTFTYQVDAALMSFTGDAQVSSAGPPPTPPGTWESVVWTHRINTTVAGSGSTLQALSGPADWNKTAYSSRSLTGGMGQVDLTFTPGGPRALYWGTYGLYLANGYANVVQLISNGSLVGPVVPVGPGDALRLETVAGGGIQVRRNGALVASVSGTASYPMALFGSLYEPNDTISHVSITGALVNYVDANCGGSPRFTGDVNGDGRQDLVCRNAAGNVAVSLATAAGFANPMIWGASGEALVGLGDFNNDGRDDIAFFNSFLGEAYVGLSNGSNFGAISSWGALGGYTLGVPYSAIACRFDGAWISRVADFNGDGRADLLCQTPADPSLQFVALSQNTNFESYIYSQVDCPIWDSTDVDTNGDGLADLVCKSPNGDLRVLQAGSGSGFGGFDVLLSFCSAGEFSFGDWNGDGTSDAACANNGRAALRTGQYFVDLGVSVSYCLSGQRLAADLDGDGAAEWICNNPGTPANDIEVRRWNGLAFAAPSIWRGGFCGGTISAGDFNGDGKKDLLCASTGGVIYAGTKNVKADLLTVSGNGIGGSSTISYTTTTEKLLGSTAGLPAKYIVTSITADDGRMAVPATTTFAYATGVQNDPDRKFFGFQTVVEYPPRLEGEGTIGPGIARKYRVDAAAAGTLEEVARYDGANNILSKTKYEYATTETTGVGARRTKLLSSIWTYRFTGNSLDCGNWAPGCGNGVLSKTDYTYDNYGNVVNIKDYGELAAFDGAGGEASPLSGDETLTTHYYAPNTGPYIVGRVGAVNRWKGLAQVGANLISSTINFYDGAGAWTTAPTKGDLTSTKSWIKEKNRYAEATTFTYDAMGNVILTKDPTLKQVSTSYGSLGIFPEQVTKGVGPAAETTTTTWDDQCGVPETTEDPNDHVTTFASDALCRPWTTSSSVSGLVETRTYLGLNDPNTQKVRVETPGADGQLDWSESYFDGFGRTYKTVRRGPAGKHIIAETTFDARGNLKSQSSPYYDTESGSKRETSFEYDRYDRRVKTKLPDNPDNKEMTYSYGALVGGLFPTTRSHSTTLKAGGPLVSQSTITKVDAAGRVRVTSQCHGATNPTCVNTTRNYDVSNRLIEVKDHLNNAWTYTYDTLGRNIAKNDPDAGVWTYDYDDAGRLITQIDAKAQATTFEYDAAGRAQYKRIRPTGGAAGAITETVETVYGTSAAVFNKGRVTTLVRKNGAGAEQNGKLAFEYDALGRLVKQTRTIDGVTYAVERNYDTAGYLRGMKYPDNDIIGHFGGSGTALGYDAAGRLKTITGVQNGQPYEVLDDVTYNAMGAPLVQTNANGTVTTKAYDPDRFWLTDIDTTSLSLTLQNLNYTMNDAGMATAVDSDETNEDWTYAYDEMNRLTSSTNGVGANNQTWSYDDIGRFTANSRVGTTFTYPSVGSPRPHAPTQISGGPLGALSFQYDANGNMETGNGRRNYFNPENQVFKVEVGPVGSPTSKTEYYYGPDGSRIKKLLNGTTVALYPFGDDYEINGSTVTKYFDTGFGPIAKKVGSTLYWLHTDRLGSINATTDDTGAQVLRRSYRGYGELLGETQSQTPTHAESLGYIGQRTDAETANGTTDDKGLTYLHARYYDSALGIFLSPDPIGADMNTYRYGFSDPVNMRDPSGLNPCYGDTFYNTHDGTLLDYDTEEPCDEGEMNFREGINQYLHDHSYPAPFKKRSRPPTCAQDSTQARCRKDPPEEPPCDPTDPNSGCYVPPEGCGGSQGFAAGEKCESAPIDKTCAAEILGGSCGKEPVFPDQSMIPTVCGKVSSVRGSLIAPFMIGNFRSGHSWDLKRKLAGGNARLGNVNYGAMMRGMGFPRGFILRGAGGYQWLQNLSNYRTIYAPDGGGPFWGSPWGAPSFGDDENDQIQVDQGIWLVDSGTCR